MIKIYWLIFIVFFCFSSTGFSYEINQQTIQNLDKLVGIKYRKDGVTNLNGDYTTFENQVQKFDTPGLNCSGFVVTATRFILNSSKTVDQYRYDLNENSGVGSVYGQDWDFGRDLIMNISGKPYESILPKSESSQPDIQSAAERYGFNLHSVDNWDDVLGQIKPNKLYLLAFSRDTTIPGYKYLYYHVGILLMAPDGGIWLYHSTPDFGVHKIQMNTDSGMKMFQGEYKQKEDQVKRIMILSVKI